MTQVLADSGKVDVLVNNAGINRRGNIMAISEDDWDATFAVNIDAMFHLCRAVIPQMMAQGGGAIVNTASQWGLHPRPTTSPTMSRRRRWRASPRTWRVTMRPTGSA